MTTPRDTPDIYDKITIAGLKTPGKCILVSGGDREMQVDIQTQPGYAGKIALYRAEELSQITYRFELWKHKDFADWRILYKILNAARKKRPRPETIEILDPRIDVGPKFTIKRISKQIDVEPGKWAREIDVIEYQKLRPIPREPANKAVQDAFKAESEKAIAERNAAQKEAAAAVQTLQTSAAPVVSAISSGLGL